MEQKSGKWINIILLALEFPVVWFLSLFTLDGDAAKQSFQEDPCGNIFARIIFAFVPILFANTIILIIIKLASNWYRIKIRFKSLFLFHNLCLFFMILVTLIIDFILYGYV